MKSVLIKCMAFLLLSGASSIADELKVLRSFDAGGPSLHLTGLSIYAIPGKGSMIYAADTAGDNSKIRVFSSEGDEISQMPVGTCAFGVLVGKGDFDPEIVVSPLQERLIRWNGENFVNMAYPSKLWGIASADSNDPYADIWAVATDQKSIVRLEYTSNANVLQTITHKGDILTDISVFRDVIYAVGSGELYKYATDGKLLERYTVPASIGKAVGVAFDPADNILWISNGSSMLFQCEAP